jgi:hypothetical protein
MKKLFTRFTKWISSAVVIKKYTNEFPSGVGVRITVSTLKTFEADFTEPLPDWLRSEYIDWRTNVLADFERRTGTKIPERRLSNERARPVPHRNRALDVSRHRVARMTEEEFNQFSK